MPTDAAERVRAALAAGQAPHRKDIERALRECMGFSARQAKRFAAGGSKAIGAADDGMDELLERVRALESTIRP